MARPRCLSTRDVKSPDILSCGKKAGGTLERPRRNGKII
jgi:hypothetical protein